MTRLIDYLEILIRTLAGVCLALVFVLVTAQVASRFVFNFSLAAASELSIFAMIWSVFLAASVAFRRSQHIAMDFIRNGSPATLRRPMEFIVYAAVSLFLIIIVFEGYELSLRAMRQVSTSAGLPVGYVSMAMPICSILSFIFLTESFVKHVRGSKKDD